GRRAGSSVERRKIHQGPATLSRVPSRFGAAAIEVSRPDRSMSGARPFIPAYRRHHRHLVAEVSRSRGPDSGSVSSELAPFRAGTSPVLEAKRGDARLRGALSGFAFEVPYARRRA